MASHKNKWRKAGRFEFRRETKRYHDGTPWGCDVLFVRIRRVGCCVVEPFAWKECAPGKTLSLLCGIHSAETPIGAARHARQYLLTQLESR